MASNSISSTLQYWLVNHPQILNFTWTQNQTPVSSPHFLILSILTYLSLTFILYHTQTSTSPSSSPLIGPRILKPITAFHNLTLFLLSLVMAVGCTLSIVIHSPDHHYALCTPLPHHFSLGPPLAICYLWLQTKQSLFPIALVTNANVHGIMYGHYLLCAMGLWPKWKRLVTDCQIVQFAFSFVVSILMLSYHFTGFGCSRILGWCFNAVFNASLLAVFLNFHSKSYALRKQG